MLNISTNFRFMHSHDQEILIFIPIIIHLQYKNDIAVLLESFEQNLNETHYNLIEVLSIFLNCENNIAVQLLSYITGKVSFHIRDTCNN